MQEEEKDIEPTSDDLYEHHRIICDPKQTALRIDKFLLDRLFKVSRNKIQHAIRAGAVKVNAQSVKPNYKVRPADVITIVLAKPPKEEGGVAPENIPLDIRYEDEDLIVLYKPAGMVVHPGIGSPNGTLVNALAYHLQNIEIPVLKGNLADRPGLVHRIDKNTTGLMVIAKTEYALNHLAKQFFDRTIQREYQAIVWGEPEEEGGTVTTDIGRHPRFRTQMTVVEEDEGGKHAVTHFKMEERLYYVSLLRCKLETGRTHQIRVHMKHIGHPVFNDEKYGGDRVVKGTVFSKYKQFVENCFELLPHQALHARSLGFEHPTTGESLFFEAEPPDYFLAVLDRWRTYVTSRQQKT